jgi:hypothetical protein
MNICTELGHSVSPNIHGAFTVKSLYVHIHVVKYKIAVSELQTDTENPTNQKMKEYIYIRWNESIIADTVLFFSHFAVSQGCAEILCSNILLSGGAPARPNEAYIFPTLTHTRYVNFFRLEINILLPYADICLGIVSSG